MIITYMSEHDTEKNLVKKLESGAFTIPIFSVSTLTCAFFSNACAAPTPAYPHPIITTVGRGIVSAGARSRKLKFVN